MTKNPVLISLMAMATSSATAAAPVDNSKAPSAFQATITQRLPALAAMYRDIHAHPEVAFQENRTAGLLASEMRHLGFVVTEHIGKTGVVAILKNGDGPTVLVRTELDALPMQEKTGLPYASHAQQVVDGTLTFVDHSCGHDVHMMWWLGAATILAQNRDLWNGTLMFIAQPAEESGGGAKAMLADGLFTRWRKPDFAFAAHIGPMPAGLVFVKAGPTSAAADEVRITFAGVGAHGSTPNESIDPIVIGSHFVTDIQSVVSREKDPSAFGVITVGSFLSGQAANIIPDKATLRVSFRSRDAATQKILADGVQRTAKAVAEMARAPAPAVDAISHYEPIYSDPALATKITEVLRAKFAKDVIFQPEAAPGLNAAEDFSEFVNAGVPSLFFGIGGVRPSVIAEFKKAGKQLPGNHSPYFAPDPEIPIERGSLTLALAAMTVAPSR